MKYIEPIPAIDGWMNSEELEWLYQKASEMETIAEIGSWMGRSTHALLSGCKGTVYAIDHFKGNPSEINSAHYRAQTDDIHAVFMANVGNFKNLKVYKMDSIEAAGIFDSKFFDMVFIDGEHEYPQPKIDIEAWLPKCKKLICGHDLRQGGVPEALQELKIEKIYQPPGTTIWSIEI